MVDIGGGSTEFALGWHGVESSLSVDMGCVRMTEKFLLHDPPLPEELSNCLAVVEQHLEDVAREVPGAGDAMRFIGLAGTVTTVAAVEIGLVEYDRDEFRPGGAATPADIAAAVAWLLSAEAGYITGQVLHVDGGRTR